MTKLAQWAGCSITQNVILEEQKAWGSYWVLCQPCNGSYLGSARRLYTETFWFQGGDRWFFSLAPDSLGELTQQVELEIQPRGSKKTRKTFLYLLLVVLLQWDKNFQRTVSLNCVQWLLLFLYRSLMLMYVLWHSKLFRLVPPVKKHVELLGITLSTRPKNLRE